MVKKQKRTRKKTPQMSANAAPKGNSKSDGVKASSFESPLTPNEFKWTIGIVLGIVAYFAAFLFAKTEFGDRFSTYLVLMLNQDFYWAFWTGEPGGSFHLLDRCPIFLGSVFHILVAFGTGSFIIGRIIRVSLYRMEHFVLSTGLGLAWISTYTLICGCFHLFFLKQLVVLPVLIVGCMGWRKFLKSKNRISDDSAESNQRHWTKWLWVGGVPFLVFMVLGSMIPPWEFDVREYHLQVPKEWFLNGGVSFLAHNVYGNMPLGTEMHALFAMLYSTGSDDWWWGTLIGKTISGMFPVLNAAVLYCIGKRIAGEFAGIGAALIYCTTPWVIANSIIGYNEGALSCYLSLSVFICVLLREKLKEETVTENASGLFFLMGQFLGGAIACKYTALPFVGFPFVVGCAVWLVWRKSGLCLRFLLWSFFGAAVICGVWFAKNYFLCGNPVYPLAESLFGSARSEIQINQWNDAHFPNPPIPSLSQVGNILYVLSFSFKWLSPLAVPFFLIGFASEKRQVLYWISAYLCFVFLTWLLLTHRLERFLLPYYSIVCLGAGVGVQRIGKSSWHNIAAGILLVGCGLNFLFGTSRLVGDVRVFASMERLDLRGLKAKDYFHPSGQIVPLSHLSPTIAWLNENRPDSNVLFFGECRPLTAHFGVIYNTCFDQCETWKRLSGKNVEEIQAQLRSDSITHILVNASELKRLQSTYGYNVNDRGRPIDVIDLNRLEGGVLRRVAESPAATELDPGVILYEVEFGN